MKKKLSLLLVCTMMFSTTVFADTTYVVKNGDTLAKIASKYNSTYGELAKYNNIENPNKIYIGDTIKIPSNDAVTINDTVISTKPVEKVVANVDTISSASTGVYYKDGTWSEEEFVEKFTEGISKHAAVSIATVNADGTPNSATIVPTFVEGEVEYLKIAFATAGNTVNNLKERNYAVITAYQHNPEEEDKFVRNNGIRLVVEVVEDQELIDKFNVGNKAPDNTLYMKIVKTLPLG